MAEMSTLSQVKEWFGRGSRKVTMDEFKALTTEDRDELRTLHAALPDNEK